MRENERERLTKFSFSEKMWALRQTTIGLRSINVGWLRFASQQITGAWRVVTSHPVPAGPAVSRDKLQQWQRSVGSGWCT